MGGDEGGEAGVKEEFLLGGDGGGADGSEDCEDLGLEE
jgi:hypothetical protein